MPMRSATSTPSTSASRTELAVEQLCGHLHAALERIDARAVAAGEVSDEYSLELVHRRAAGARR